MQLNLANFPTVTPAYDSNLSPALRLQCKDLFFRQSFISDYLACPQMSLYRWVLSLEEEQPWFAGILGTAGHEVIFQMHEAGKFDYTYMELSGMFEEAFNKDLQKQHTLPNIAKAFHSLDEEFAAKAPDYVRFLKGYQEHHKNQDFHSTLHEQNFVLVIPRLPRGTTATLPEPQLRLQGQGSGKADSSLPVSGSFAAGGVSRSELHSSTSESTPVASDAPIIFTGIVDQLGYYSNGTLAVRDIKFRDKAFKPGYTELALNNQLTVYSAALKWGVPSCAQCKPSYETDQHTGAKLNLVYHGPCDHCQKIYESNLWPKRYPDVVELIWLRDFDRHAKDQYAKFIKDPDGIKEKSAETGRMRIREIVNPKYHEGYKVGDYCGPGFLSSPRTEAKTEVLMTDVVRICEEIRNAAFYRKPSDYCNFMCKYRNYCLDAVETQVQEIDMSKVAEYATYNPFGE